jgi:hypothetical protein
MNGRVHQQSKMRVTYYIKLIDILVQRLTDIASI